MRCGGTVIGGAVVAFLLLTACTDDAGTGDPAGGEAADPVPPAESSTSGLPPSSSTGPSTTGVVPSPEADADDCTPPTLPPVRDGLDATVTVYLYCGDGGAPVDLRPVERVVPAQAAVDPLLASMEQLLIGATPAEARAGLESAFSPYTAGAVRGVEVDAGLAVVDFEPAFATANNFSTSNLSAVVLSQVQATVFQFPEITGIEFGVAGERWCGWQNTCDAAAVPLIPRS